MQHEERRGHERGQVDGQQAPSSRRARATPVFSNPAEGIRQDNPA
jgi:hypothetical protein